MATAAFRKFSGHVSAGGSFVSKFGRGVGLRVTNNSGSDIAADKLVVISGWDATNKVPQISLAQATTTGHDDIYVTSKIITNANARGGYIYKGGLSAATLNVGGSAGDTVYLSDSSAGGFVVTTPPTTANARIRPVGFVKVVSATVGQVIWSISPASQQEPTTGFFVQSVTAAGSTQGDAGAITAASPAIVVVTGANTTKGARLPASAPGSLVIVQNQVTNQTVAIWPATGEIINALASNASYTMAGAKSSLFACEVAGTWFTVLTA